MTLQIDQSDYFLLFEALRNPESNILFKQIELWHSGYVVWLACQVKFGVEGRREGHF
jgi:hypothetical protein